MSVCHETVEEELTHTVGLTYSTNSFIKVAVATKDHVSSHHSPVKCEMYIKSQASQRLSVFDYNSSDLN